MFLSDLQPGTAIQITAARGVRAMDFSSNVISVDGTNVKIEPILQDGKLVGFDNPGIIVSMYVASKEDNRVYVFPGVKIHSYKVSDGTMFQEVECRREEGRVTNRRGAHRVWVGATGSVLLGENNREHTVTIKDISATGIAFVCDDATDVPMGTPLTISFTDSKQNRSFRLIASAIRTETNSEYRRIIYGCKFKEESNAISRYVNDKQRQNLKETRTVDSTRRGYRAAVKD